MSTSRSATAFTVVVVPSTAGKKVSVTSAIRMAATVARGGDRTAVTGDVGVTRRMNTFSTR